jgi:hypothetical protein
MSHLHSRSLNCPPDCCRVRDEGARALGKLAVRFLQHLSSCSIGVLERVEALNLSETRESTGLEATWLGTGVPAAWRI